MKQTSSTIHLWIAKGLIALSAFSGIVTFVSLPILSSKQSPATRVLDGVVAGASAVYVDEPLIRFPQLMPTQEFTPFDTASVSADSFAVLDTKTSELLVQKNPDQSHPLASLTKLVSALLLMERGFQESTSVVGPGTITQNVAKFGIPFDTDDPASRIKLGISEEFTSQDLLKASLIASANDAIFALVESQGLDPEKFREIATEYFTKNGYVETKLFEPSGLDYRNTSTAREYAHLANDALSFAQVRENIELPSTVITSTSTSNTYSMKTTNALLVQNDAIIGGKTGYLDASGYTFVVLARHESGRELLIVLLGSRSAASRIEDTDILLAWLNNNFAKVGMKQ